MNKENLSFVFMLLSVLVAGVLIGFRISRVQSCQPAEVYMVGSVQEDDLFIPESSIGRVDLKR